MNTEKKNISNESPDSEVIISVDSTVGGEPVCALEFEIAIDGAEDSAQEKTEPAPEPESTPEPTIAEPEVELTVEADVMPNVFDVVDTHENASSPSGVRTTYLPRFTDVSDNYHMRSSGSVSDKNAIAPDNEYVDPTAEIGEDAGIERVVVSSGAGNKPEHNDDSITVFKFDTEEQNEAPLEKNEVAHDGKAPTEPPTPEKEPTPEPNIEPAPEKKALKDASEYDIPDPEEYMLPKGYSDDDDTPDVQVTGPKVKHEFISPIQRDNFKDKFLDTLMAVRVRLIAVILIFLAMSAVEILGLLNIGALELIGVHVSPAGYSVIDLAFVICISVLVLPEIVHAACALARGRVLPELALIPSIVALLAYTFIVYRSHSVEYLCFGMLYGIQALAAILATLYRVKGDYSAFKLCAKSSVKSVLIKKLTRELPRENIALDGVVDEYKSKTARMFRTGFVSDFYSNSSKTVENTKNNILIIAVAFAAALVTSIVSYFIFGKSLLYAAQSFLVVYLVSTPAFSILSHKLPYKQASVVAGKEGNAFVGEGAIYEGADIDVIAYEDTEIFGTEDVSIRKVHLYGRVYNTAKAMEQMYSLFSVVGGPLNAVFTAALARRSDSASDVVVESDGICGMLSGHRICAGTEEYMRRNGISIPDDGYRTGSSTTDSTRIMYGAEDGAVYVKFHIRYSFSEEFTMILPFLKEQKIIPLIYTRDPNISNELLKILTLGDDAMRVMRRGRPASLETKTYRHLSSPLVTLGNKENAINMLLLSRRYTAFQSTLAVTELISTAVGAALAVLLSLGGMISAASGIVCGLSLWQIGWCVVLYVRSRMRI